MHRQQLKETGRFVAQDVHGRRVTFVEYTTYLEGN
jgi:hypothetical protein